MKSILILAVMLLGVMSLTSCSSGTVNELKIKAAVEVQEAVEKELTKSYEDVEIPGYVCSDEVGIIGDKVYKEVAKLLKIREASSSLSGSSILAPVCEFVGQQILPKLIIGSSGSDYKCLKYIGAEGVKKISSQLCSYISI